jgi:hypothetical protein
MRAAGSRERQRRGQHACWRVLVTGQSPQPVHRIAAQRRRVLPAFAEHGPGIAGRRTADRDVRIMPGRPVPVDGRYRQRLRISCMRDVITAPMTQIDAAGERDIQPGTARMAQDHELLVMRAARPYPHVEQAPAARGLDIFQNAY